MSVYTKYTVTSSKELLCLYICEKCRSANLCKVQVRGQSTYTSKGAGFRRSTAEYNMEERNRSAQADALDSVDGVVTNLILNPSVDALSKAGFKCKCKKCGKRPYWTMSILNLLKYLAEFVTVLSVIFMLVAFDNLSTPWLVLIPCGLLWILFLVYRSYCEKQLEKRTHPLFADNLNQLKERKARYKEYADITV